MSHQVLTILHVEKRRDGILQEEIRGDAAPVGGTLLVAMNR
ncbi:MULTISPECIES: hypothetical protein [Bacillaceae]|nr:hypothetical protein [Bacillus sp. S3]